VTAGRPSSSDGTYCAPASVAPACAIDAPEQLRRCDALHWGDNSSAVAAIVKGYSSMPDSARLVHATHALLAGMEVRAWFEYVRTKANVSDEPSRDDLSQVRYECLCGGDETLVGVVRSALVSAPIAAAMPPAAWLRGGRDEGVAAAWVRRGLAA
jgi:hypothetical protein